ncbi:MAG: hypothetical protein ACFFDT_26740 [Candidatus Hodarchaeota archaeon]
MKKFYLLIVKNLEVDASGAAFYGTKYDMKKACPKCGTGAIPTGSRYMSGLKKLRKGLFLAGYGELLASVELAEKLISLGIKNLAEVYNTKGIKMPFMEIRGEDVLPPFSQKTAGYAIDEQCPVCKRNGYFDLREGPLRLFYEKVDRSLLEKHILITYERFGYSYLRTPFKDSVLAKPKFIVSCKVKNLLEEEKVRGLEFEPVTILSTSK